MNPQTIIDHAKEIFGVDPTQNKTARQYVFARRACVVLMTILGYDVDSIALEMNIQPTSIKSIILQHKRNQHPFYKTRYLAMRSAIGIDENPVMKLRDTVKKLAQILREEGKDERTINHIITSAI